MPSDSAAFRKSEGSLISLLQKRRIKRELHNVFFCIKCRSNLLTVFDLASGSCLSAEKRYARGQNEQLNPQNKRYWARNSAWGSMGGLICEGVCGSSGPGREQGHCDVLSGHL